MIIAQSNLVSAVSKRPHNMSLSYGDTRDSLTNRKDFLGSLGIDHKDLVCARQVHGSGIKYVTARDKGKGALTVQDAIPATDGLITDVKGLPLAIFTADCLSVFLYDKLHHAVGLVHAGWRGTREHIVSKALVAMQENFGSMPEDLYAGFGPLLRECCYQVGDEFSVYFPLGVNLKAERLYLDLAGINKKELLDFGICQDNILDASSCTFCSGAEYFSWRKESTDAGRMISVMMLK